MHWYGLACISLLYSAFFAIYPPDYFGASSAGLAYITLLFLILLHVFCNYHKTACGRSIWSILYVMYHLCIFFWIGMVLILGMVWSEENYLIQ